MVDAATRNRKSGTSNFGPDDICNQIVRDLTNSLGEMWGQVARWRIADPEGDLLEDEFFTLNAWKVQIQLD